MTASSTFIEEVERFSAALPDDTVARDKEGRFARDTWQSLADFGFIGLAMPKEFGGSEKGGLDTGVQAMEALGYGQTDLGLAFALSAQMWTVMMPLLEFGTDDQKSRYLPGLCGGNSIGCHGLTEPDAGSDVFALRTRAVACEGGVRMTGVKHLISLAPIADLALVFATTDPDKGRWGVASYLVELSWEGITKSPVRDKMGLRTVPIGEIHFDDVFVPEANRMSAPGAGFWQVQKSLEFDRCCILAAQVGVMRRQLKTAIHHARSRKQFDQTIGRFQAVSHRIAEMKLRVETARLLLREVAALKMADKPAAMESAMLKLHLSESFVASSLDAIRTHGGTGYLSDTGVERDLRDAVGGVLYAGTSDIQRNIIAGLLGL